MTLDSLGGAKGEIQSSGDKGSKQLQAALRQRLSTVAPGFDATKMAEMVEALYKIVTACKKTNRRAVLHCAAPDDAARGIEWVFNMTKVS